MILLDTHVLLWFAAGDEQIGRRSVRLAQTALDDDQLAVSALSFWEVGMLAAKRRVALDSPLKFWQLVRDQGLHELPVTGRIGIAAAEIDGLHSDPADRIIVATALAHDAVLVTADRRLLDWDGPLKAQDARV